MTWLLDTNACIQYLNGRSPSLKSKLESTDLSQIVVASIVKAELYFGAARSSNPPAAKAGVDQFVSRFTSLSFDDVAAEVHAVVRADLARRGTPIGPHDLLIAAICLANDVILVTHNTGEFRRVGGLKLEDWQ